VLAALLGDSVTLSLYLDYVFNRDETVQVRASVDSAVYTGQVFAKCGTDPLLDTFCLPEPTPPESGDVWQGVLVGLRLTDSDSATGSIWLDNLTFCPVGPTPEYSYWQAYDTVMAWSLEPPDGPKTVFAQFRTGTGVENAVPLVDSVILDMTLPCPYIQQPSQGLLVNGTVALSGWAYDPISHEGDTWFLKWTMSCRHTDSANWLPVKDDSAGYSAIYPDWNSPVSPAQPIGDWQTESLPDGEYWIKLTVVDSAANEDSFQTWVTVDNSGGLGGRAAGPEGGGTGSGSGSIIYIGSATGNVLHLSEDLDSLDAFSVSDSGT
jgi:hypothetical protein